MKQFEYPELKVITLVAQDVITASGEDWELPIG